MAIGPAQIIALGSAIPAYMARSSPSWSGRAKGTWRVIGSLAASKNTGEEEAEMGEIADAGDTAAYDGVHVLTGERLGYAPGHPGRLPRRRPSSITGRFLRCAICPRRGFRISKGFISPLDLCAIGLLPGRSCGG